MDLSAFEREYGLTLNPQQEAAVACTQGPGLLLAVPGSGKTTVIVARLGYMVLCRGIPPEHILTVTYTVAATADMRRRFAKVFGEELAGRMAFRTINGLCALIIRRYEQVTGRTAFRLVSDEGEITRLLREILQSVLGGYPTESDIRELRTRLSYCKNSMLTPEEIRQEKLEGGGELWPLYRQYQDTMRRRRWMDYDDQMVYGLQILKSRPDILGEYRRRYRYISVDEAQDTSRIQHTILRLLAGEEANLFLVGDEDQSIYGFRAAWPQALLEFDQVYPQAKVLFMEENYRCSGAITRRADAFIRRNTQRRDKHMFTRNGEGSPIRAISLQDGASQYRYLLRVARECEGETAVLYRNHHSVLPLIDLLEREGVPYRCRPGEGTFFSHALVRDITDAIRLAYRPTDGALFERLYYKLGTGLKKERLQAALRRQSRAWDMPITDLILDDPALEPWAAGRVKALRTHLTHLLEGTSLQAVHRIYYYMGYQEYLQQRGADTSRVRPLMALANQNPELEAFLDRLEELEGVVAAGGSDPESPFILSTIHASKGLEYDRVILLDVLDGVFPQVAEPREGERLSPEDLAVLEEERRLFYVAVTRARRQLEVLTFTREYGRPAPPRSSFIDALVPPEGETAPAGGSVTREEEDQFRRGTRVRHRRFGAGEVLRREGSVILVALDNGENRKFDLRTCLKGGLLRRET